MTMLHTDITCPKCGVIIHIPFMRALETKAIEEFDMLESTAQTKLANLNDWLDHASLWTLFKFWLRRD